MAKKRTTKPTPAPANSEAIVRPIGIPLQKMEAEKLEELGIHPAIRERLKQYDTAIAENNRIAAQKAKENEMLAFAKREAILSEIAREGMSVAPTKSELATADDYSYVSFYLPMRRVIEPTPTA